ncbi:MAG TPA: DegT/DnrJ/EryC1/StrS family aminotransferase [Candidatus Dormibacteraeota bacterium]
METLKTIPIAAPQIGEEERQAVLAVLDSGQLAQGPVVEDFERAFARFCGVANAVAISNGTAALHLLLLAHGLKAGDEVITTSFSFVSSANSALFVGARPVFVDIEQDTYNLDPDRVEGAITPKTRAIMPVDLYGHPAAVAEIREIARRHDLVVVEDACQAHGATIDGVKTGALGVSAAFSFYPTKNMTTSEGGMVTTDDDELAAKVRVLRQHGATTRYRHEVLGYNFRLTELAAAIGRAQLAKLDRFNQARRRNAAILSHGLAGIPGLVTPIERQGYGHVYHQYTVRVEKDRDRVSERLRELGVGTAIHYPIPVHKQPLYIDLGYGSISLPISERMAGQVLSLPVHPGLTDADLDRIIESVRSAVTS